MASQVKRERRRRGRKGVKNGEREREVFPSTEMPMNKEKKRNGEKHTKVF